MAQFPPKKSLSDAGTAKITHTSFPQVWLRPKDWENDFKTLQKELDKCNGPLKPLEDSSKVKEEKLCLVHQGGYSLERGVVKSYNKDGKCTVLLIDTGCEIDISMEGLFEVPEAEEPGRNISIMEHPILCTQVCWGDSITDPKMNLFVQTVMMELPYVDYEILDGSAGLVPVVKLTAGVGDLLEEIKTLYKAFYLSLQQPASSSPIPVFLDPTPGKVLSEGAVITKLVSSENFTIMDLATKKEVVCFAGKMSKAARIKFSRKVNPLRKGNEDKIFLVFCKNVLEDNRCHVTVTNIPYREHILEVDPSVQ